ncbi:MAG: general secretion pathway protein GspM [Bradyrhizobium sp.]|nr:general secretion pathway protein GspM [Bradyrhizobium sp.]
MTPAQRVEKLIAQAPWAAVALYPVLVGVFIFIVVTTLIDLSERRDAWSAAQDILRQVQGRSPARPGGAGATEVVVPAGSPFLEGSTISVAGAALLQRLTGAITRVGGNILSSQVDLQNSPSKPGFISVTASSELDGPSLQPLLYDIEAGMPFLFIDQLVVQAPSGTANDKSGKMRVLISVSGQWQRAK